MKQLSVIIPAVCEWPQIIFTIRSIHEELRGKISHEIICIDNWCDEVAKQGQKRDRGSEHIREQAEIHGWLTYLEYNKKLSHWQAKNYGVSKSSGKFIWFCDAHCSVGRDALYNMVTYYEKHHEELNGTMHLPLTYHILEDRQLIYKLVANPKMGEYTYSFKSHDPKSYDKPFEVPVMSTCGMLMTRTLFNQIGWFPEELGIYGGGEQFVNTALAVIGKKKWIYPGNPLHHHGDKRGYSWNSYDYFRNRVIAAYISQGTDVAKRYLDCYTKSNPINKHRIWRDVTTLCRAHQTLIQSQAVMTIEEWHQKYLDNE